LPTWQELERELPYLRNVVKEGLRYLLYTLTYKPTSVFTGQKLTIPG